MTTKILYAALGSLAVLLPPPTTAAPTAEALIRAKCLPCHTESSAGISRIGEQRKTPEGWLMSVARMQIIHGLKVTDEERRTVVKYLADTQGLAPSETTGMRYALERRLNTMEKFDSAQFTEMCARCHSGARVLLQRRPESEWEHLVHFHLGQFVTTEYQALGRDRDWFGIALNEMVPELARTLPLDSPAWKQWLARTPLAVNGDWVVSGHMSGRGGFSGVMTVSAAKGRDRHALRFEGQWDDGVPMRGEGQAQIYTGYEWRGELVVDGTPMRQVFQLEDGSLHGRMFERDHDEIGADVRASLQRAGNRRVLAVHPDHLQAGSEGELRIVGSQLDGELALPAGVRALQTVQRSDAAVVVRVQVDADARGVHEVGVGQARGGTLALYDRIAALKVEPAFAVARFGGNGTPTAKVQARFDAEAWAAGADGEPGTADDFRIGIVPAKWSVEAFDEAAARDEDVRFAGRMEAERGVFMPGDAGPNPARRMSASNVGNLKVVAEVEQDGGSVRGEGQLVVSPPRWNDPPIP